MGASVDRSGTAGVGLRPRGTVPERSLARSMRARALEALGVGLAPAIAALVLRLRLMAPDVLADPGIHTVYIVDPRDHLTRFGGLLAQDGGLREASRVGFLVPARLAYLAFGAVPGFFVARYVFALIAVVPVYLLLRRLYGPPAGVAGMLVILSSPVIVTAWGTDYPDSAVVSYATGAIACLAMPCARRWRRAWLAAAGALLTLAVWSHGMGVPLAAATLAAYLAVRLARNRAGLPVDLALLAGIAAAVTGVLAVASGMLFGRFDFIAPTWQAYQYLSTPAQTAEWHTANDRWLLYVAYLLVPPAVIAAFAVAVTRRAVPTPALFAGMVATAQLMVYLYLQFAGGVQALELHYFSSPLWSGVCVALAVTIAELSRPLAARPVARWLPAAVLLAVPLGYEAYPHVPSFGWAPFGIILAVTVVAAAAAARTCARFGPRLTATATGLTLIVLTGAILVLTVAPPPRGFQRHVKSTDAPPAYSSALGGSGAAYIDGYRIASELPGFVGQATYPGEVILPWPVTSLSADYMIEAFGMYFIIGHGWLTSTEPRRDRREELQVVRPAQVLLLGSSAARFPAALRSLTAYRPTLTHTGALRSGPLVLHVWVIRLGVYYHPPALASSQATVDLGGAGDARRRPGRH
jgi:hypothetical protein